MNSEESPEPFGFEAFSDNIRNAVKYGVPEGRQSLSASRPFRTKSGICPHCGSDNVARAFRLRGLFGLGTLCHIPDMPPEVARAFRLRGLFGLQYRAKNASPPGVARAFRLRGLFGRKGLAILWNRSLESPEPFGFEAFSDFNIEHPFKMPYHLSPEPFGFEAFSDQKTEKQFY